MARITVEDCLTEIPNRFLLVNLVAKRVRQIREGSEYLVNSPKNEDVVVALREIAAGKISMQKATPRIEAADEADGAPESAEAEEAAETEASEADVEPGAVEEADETGAEDTAKAEEEDS